MVSFWPFGNNDANSPKSYEKALANLSSKITRLQKRRDTLHATHRRVKVLFTLYSSFVYILVVLILTLVTGYEKWQAQEWSAVAASPVAIVAIRYIVDFYFDWRENNVKTRLDKAVKERDKVIKKLKDAMRYDSTKELLDKYGGTEGRRVSGTDNKLAQRRNTSGRAGQQQQQRTTFVPPPTANIQGRKPPAPNAIDTRLRSSGNPNEQSQPQIQWQSRSVPHSRTTSASFAPNAFPSPPGSPVQAQNPQSGQLQPPHPGVLDRILDLVLGDDENAPKNRIALICSSCRLVNGQAPPGTKSLEALGRWRCGSCGAWNGVETEASKVLNEAKARVEQHGDLGETVHKSKHDRPISSISAPAAIGETNEEEFEELDSNKEHDELHKQEPEDQDSQSEDGDVTDNDKSPAHSTRSKARH